MAISGVGATPEPQKNDKTEKVKEKNINENKSIFSKYDSNQDGKVDANEQRIALTYFVNNLYKNLKKNMNERAINIIHVFSKHFKDISTNGSKNNAEEVNQQIDSMLNRFGDNVIKLANGTDRTKDFKSHKEFLEAKDSLKEGDYCISEKGYIYQFNGKDKNWSLYSGEFN